MISYLILHALNDLILHALNDLMPMVEVVTLRLSAIGETEKPALTSEPLADADPSDARISQNSVIFDGEVYPTDFYQRESLRPGNRIEVRQL